MMRLLIAATLLLTACSTAYGEELWACDGFTSSRDNSSNGPFLLRGNGSYYQYRESGLKFEIKKIGENRGFENFDIYIDIVPNALISTYYLMKDETSLQMKKFRWPFHFFADCRRQ